MNRDDVIRMAREAGIEWQENTTITGRRRVTTCGSQPVEKIEHLVAVAYAAGAAAEREACAKVCDEQVERSKEALAKAKRVTDQAVYRSGAQTAAWNAAAIRARGQA